MRPTLQVTTHETIFVYAQLERSSAGVFDGCSPVFLDQGKHSQDAADAGLSLSVIDRLAEPADLRSSMFGPAQQLGRAQWHFLGVIFFLDAISAALLAQVLTKKLVGVRMQDTHVQRVPLHLHRSPDPSWRQAVVGGFHFHATIQMNHALSVLVVAEGF